MTDNGREFPVDELRRAAGEDRTAHARIDALGRELDSDNPVRASIDSHVAELRKHPSLSTLIANWFDDPRTQAFIDELTGTGL
jgi:hypothetical protein